MKTHSRYEATSDWLIDIVSILPPPPPPVPLDPDQIEALARSIVELGGVIHPLIVAKAGVNADGEDQFRLVAGDLQYAAAVRALELDPKQEMVRAYIAQTPEQELAFQRQLAILAQA